jgi:hypothetical protein
MNSRTEAKEHPHKLWNWMFISKTSGNALGRYLRHETALAILQRAFITGRWRTYPIMLVPYHHENWLETHELDVYNEFY